MDKQLNDETFLVSPTKVSEDEQQDDISEFPIEKSMRDLLRDGKHLNQDAIYTKLFQELPEEEIMDKIELDYGREQS